MFNGNTRMAGFYHVPGKTTLHGESTMKVLGGDDWDIVKPMAEKVQPTRVVIFPGNDVGSVLAARVPMQAAFNATRIASLSNMRISQYDAPGGNRLKMPEKRKVSLAVGLDGQKMKFTMSRPDFVGDEWFESKRNLDKKPTEERDGISFWGWEVNVAGFRQLSTF